MKNQKEILFRGISLESKEWVYGSLVVGKYNKYIIPAYDDTIKSPDWTSVYNDSICQYTGLKDADGVNIFDKDIVEYRGYTYEIDFEECGFLCGIGDDSKDNTPYPDTIYERPSLFKIVGNTRDNTELLNEF